MTAGLVNAHGGERPASAAHYRFRFEQGASIGMNPNLFAADNIAY